MNLRIQTSEIVNMLDVSGDMYIFINSGPVIEPVRESGPKDVVIQVEDGTNTYETYS